MNIYTIEFFISRFCNTVISFIKILLFSKFKPDILKLREKKETCYILGNGPSLSKDLLDNSDCLKRSELIVVNFFAKSDLFQQLKPNYYVLADPAFFSDNHTKELCEKVINLFDEIKNKTTWDLFVMIPYEGYKYIKSHLCSNPNIHIIRYNKVSSRKSFLWFDRFIHNKQLAIFSGMNVVTVASYLAIVIGFKEINLIGVDHSCFKNYHIGKDNKIYLEDPHFYDDSKNLVLVELIDPKTKKISRLHELLLCDVIAFETYHMIEEYAQYKKVKIFNKCSSTYIDAFERKL